MQLIDVERLLGGNARRLTSSRRTGRFSDLVKLLGREFQLGSNASNRDPARSGNYCRFGDCAQRSCLQRFSQQDATGLDENGKLQRASLDPTKISGPMWAGLKVLPRYEFETYEITCQRTTVDRQRNSQPGKALPSPSPKIFSPGKLIVTTDDQRRIMIPAGECSFRFSPPGQGRRRTAKKTCETVS